MQIYTYPDPYVCMRKIKPILFYIDANGCHICISHSFIGHGKSKYPQINRAGIKMAMHRYVYFLEKGPIPKGMEIMHSCDNPQCINILHLSEGTHKDNMQDKTSKNRHSFGENHGRAKLTTEQVFAILDDPRHYELIAMVYGVTTPNIYYIKNGKSWVKVWREYHGAKTQASLQLR